MTPRYAFFAKYGKSIVSVLAAVYAVVIAKFTGDHHIDLDEGIVVVSTAAAAALVYVVPMAPQWRWGKSACQAVVAGLAVFQTARLDGRIDLNEAWLIAGTVLGALGVIAAPAVSETREPDPDVVVHWGTDAS